MGTTPPFAQQRILFFALPLGVIVFAIAIAVVHADHDLSKALATGVELSAIVWPVAAGALLGAFTARRALQARADALGGDARARTRFLATLVPLAVLEGGALFGLVAWMLSAQVQPGLVAALALLAAMLVLVPLQDPDAGVR